MQNNTSIQAAKEAHPIYQTICENGSYVTVPNGKSMLPMLRSGKDSVLLVPAPAVLQKGEIALYLRRDGTPVLHRVRAVSANGYTMCGDGQTDCEYAVPHAAVLGVVKGFWRGERYCACTAKRYRVYVGVWCLSLRLRKVLLCFVRKG